MTALDHFQAVWMRCSNLATLYAYLSKNVSGVIQADELLRAEWVARVSALDLYIHELVAQSMREIFEGRRPPTPAYLEFRISNETLGRIRAATTISDAGAAFDLYVRDHLSRVTFQAPDKIADGIRLFSSVELWADVAVNLGADQSNKKAKAKQLKRQLSLVIRRRNIIAHEGDLQQSALRDPWPITKPDLELVEKLLEQIVKAIDVVV